MDYSTESIGYEFASILKAMGLIHKDFNGRLVLFNEAREWVENGGTATVIAANAAKHAGHGCTLRKENGKLVWTHQCLIPGQLFKVETNWTIEREIGGQWMIIDDIQQQEFIAHLEKGGKIHDETHDYYYWLKDGTLVYGNNERYAISKFDAMDKSLWFASHLIGQTKLSIIPIEKTRRNIRDVVYALTEGQCIKRQSWTHTWLSLSHRESKAMVCLVADRGDGTHCYMPWQPSLAELAADDWVICE